MSILVNFQNILSCNWAKYSQVKYLDFLVTNWSVNMVSSVIHSRGKRGLRPTVLGDSLVDQFMGDMNPLRVVTCHELQHAIVLQRFWPIVKLNEIQTTAPKLLHHDIFPSHKRNPWVTLLTQAPKKFTVDCLKLLKAIKTKLEQHEAIYRNRADHVLDEH